MLQTQQQLIIQQQQFMNQVIQQLADRRKGTSEGSSGAAASVSRAEDLGLPNQAVLQPRLSPATESAVRSTDVLGTVPKATTLRFYHRLVYQ